MNVIYALREHGSDEVRYIGRTRYPLSRRLRKHQANAARGYPPDISRWLQSACSVEIVPVSVCCDAAACAEERRIVEQYHKLGHRLTNGHLLPRQTGSAA